MSCPFECHCWPHSAAQLPRHADELQQEQHSTFKRHIRTGNHLMYLLPLYLYKRPPLPRLPARRLRAVGADGWRRRPWLRLEQQVNPTV